MSESEFPPNPKSPPASQPESDAFVERIATNFAPADLRPNARAALNRELWQRVEQRRRRRLPVAATLVTATAVAALAWFGPAFENLTERAPDLAPTRTVVANTTEAASARDRSGRPLAGADTETPVDYDDWELALLFPASLDTDPLWMDVEPTLPDEYEGIAAALLDG